MHLSVAFGVYPTVQTLIVHGASVNQMDDEDDALIHICAKINELKAALDI